MSYLVFKSFVACLTKMCICHFMEIQMFAISWKVSKRLGSADLVEISCEFIVCAGNNSVDCALCFQQSGVYYTLNILWDSHDNSRISCFATGL